MSSAPIIPIAAETASTSSRSTDAFDAIVQAANPSHPNHAAWIEKFGGNTPRRTTATSSNKDTDSNSHSHLEHSASPGPRRRRSISNNGSRGAIPQFISDIQEYGRRSRAASSGIDERAQQSRSPSKGLEDETSQQERRETEELARRRRRRRREKEKEKERSAVPPVPPPRTTSHALQFLSTPEVMPPLLPNRAPSASPPSYHTSPATSRGHSSFADSFRPPVAPRSPLRVMSNHSRTISAQMPSSSTLPGTPEQTALAASSARTSPIQSRFDADPPNRMSSRVPPSTHIDGEYQSTARSAADSPTQTVSNTSISVSRKGSFRSVDFVLPEEPIRRESLDSNKIRKSFDALTSSFRSTSKASSNNQRSSDLPRKASKATILKSSYDTPYRFTAPNAISPPTSPVSRLAIETENGISTTSSKASRLQQQRDLITAPESPKVPVQSLIVYEPQIEAAQIDAGTEEGEDFQDVQSDVGGNGSSAEEGGVRSNGATSTVKKKAKKKNVDVNGTRRSRKKSAAKTVSGIDAYDRKARVKADSSASEDEVQGAVRRSLQGMPDVVKDTHEARRNEQVLFPVQQTQAENLNRREDVQVETVKSQLPSYAPVPSASEVNWRDRFDQQQSNTNFSNLNRGYPYKEVSYKEEAPSLPLVFEPSNASASTNVNAFNEKQEDSLAKSTGRSSGRPFAGVMARIRRDRTSSSNLPSKESPKNVEERYLETEAPFGLGIATPTSTATITEPPPPPPPQKSWRNRLTSFSGKSPKSPPKNDEDWRIDYVETPLPPMPAKAKKMLATKTYAGMPMEVDRDRNRQTMLEVLNQRGDDKTGAQNVTMINQELSKKSLDFSREVGLSPTIHKTLSPALLTNQKHEADEVISIIGSEAGDVENKQATWTSLGQLNVDSNEALDRESSPRRVPVLMPGSRPSMDSRSFRDDSQQRGRDMPMTPPARRSSFSRSRIASLNVDGSSRKLPSPSSNTSAPPLPVTPARKIERSPVEDESKQQSPFASRASLDYRMPSWTRGLSRPSMSQIGASTIRGPSLNLDRDRMPSEFLATNSPSAKVTKRFFTSSSKVKTPSKGISSNDFNSPYQQLVASKSEMSLGVTNDGIGRSREDLRELHGVDEGTRSRMFTYQMNHTTIPPSNSTNSRTNQSVPITSPSLHHFTTEEENAAFDKMLRESAREDAARVKQIASRTAQAHALRL